MSKIKLLFVVYDFYQAGAQRFVYEIDRALDKEKYETTILCLKGTSNVDKDWKSFYDQKHKDLGSKIVFFDKYMPNSMIIHKGLRKLERTLLNNSSKDYNRKLPPFLSQFQLIHWIGEYTFLHQLPMNIVEKSLISIMSARFQNPELYKRFDFSVKYNFASGFSTDECAFEFQEFREYNHWYIPLLLKIPCKQNKWQFKDSEIKKIGIFTRLDRYKPLDPFFYAFHLLLDQLPNCELHIFGNGDPEKEGMIRYLKNLNISDKVVFRGHQEDITQTAISEHIDISWFQGYNNNRPAGYAGFDICSTGTPLICWDFLENPTNPFNDIYPHYKNLQQFSEKSLEILLNKNAASNLSDLQFNDVLMNRDIDKNIYLIENAFNGIINR